MIPAAHMIVKCLVYFISPKNRLSWKDTCVKQVPNEI